MKMTQIPFRNYFLSEYSPKFSCATGAKFFIYANSVFRHPLLPDLSTPLRDKYYTIWLELVIIMTLMYALECHTFRIIYFSTNRLGMFWNVYSPFLKKIYCVMAELWRFLIILHIGDGSHYVLLLKIYCLCYLLCDSANPLVILLTKCARSLLAESFYLPLLT